MTVRIAGIAKPRWYVLLDGPAEDVSEVRRSFAGSEYQFDEIDGKFALSASTVEACGNRAEAADVAMELVASMNTVLRFSIASYVGFNFWGLFNSENGKMHRFMVAEGFAVGLRGVSVVASAGGMPVRSREERLVSLLGQRDELQDIMNSLASRPITWPAMKRTYETVVGLMSAKSSNQRQDYETIIKRGWLTQAQSEQFYHTASYHSHGYPRTPVRGGVEMEYTDARSLIARLVWHLVDELEPA